MSTKLYGGLKFKDPSQDIFDFVPKIAEVIESEFTKAAAELVAKELIHWIDSPTQWPEESKRISPLFDAKEAWQKRQQDYGHHHALNDPLRFSIVFGRSSAGNLLAYAYYNEDRYRKALNRLRIFDEYHYQNSTDRPKGISKKAWEQRYNEWDSLLNKNGTLGHLPMWEFGRSKEPFSEVFMRNANNFDGNSGSTIDNRLKRILLTPLFQRVVEELKCPKDKILGMMFEVEQTITSYLKTPEGELITRPAPIPSGISFRYSDIESYEIDPVLLNSLLQAHLERIGS